MASLIKKVRGVNFSQLTYDKSAKRLRVAQWQDRYAFFAPEPGLISPGEGKKAKGGSVLEL
jgi:hypothetical protein